jgi:general secretion pathway protein G
VQGGFSLIEIMIVVSLLGIITAIIIPNYLDYSKEAKEAAAKDTLRMMRSVVELYSAKNSDVPPGYIGNNIGGAVSWTAFWAQVVRDGKYINNLPINPFNNLQSFNMISNSDAMPAEATGNSGWIYKPSTRDFRLDWPGKDSQGIDFYSY